MLLNNINETSKRQKFCFRLLDLSSNFCMTFLNCYCMKVYYFFTNICTLLSCFHCTTYEHNWPYNKLIDKYQPRNVPLDRRLSIPLHSSQTIKQLIDLLAAQLLYNFYVRTFVLQSDTIRLLK